MADRIDAPTRCSGAPCGSARDIAARAVPAGWLVLLLAACTAGGEVSGDDIGGGKVSVQWEDGDTVAISIDAPGTARWCAAGRWLELSAVEGDTGIMIALFPPESLVTGTYPVARPVRDDSVRPRPGATLGVRWFTPGLVAGFRGWEGEVRLTGVADGEGRTVSGRFQGSAAALAGDAGALAVEGEFERVPVTAADSGCSAVS